MNLNVMGIVSLILVAVGVFLILLGAWLSLAEWKKAHATQIRDKAQALGDTLSSLAKVLEAMKDYPTGQRLIILGIIILVIAGLFGGISSL
ncbi:MAG TPA: hypothetical protein VME86_15560 [Acidobacteriaceae bacterium]|nr:hypothetical protein [Acidobacteriaceae bacterium]